MRPARPARKSGPRARLGLAAALALAPAVVAVAQPRPSRVALPALPVRVAIVADASGPAVGDAWLGERFSTAQELLAGSGVRVMLAGTRPLDARHADLETRADRSALARLLEPNVVNVFVVRVLRDVDEVGLRQGVHWHVGRKHYVIVAATSGRTTLCHELGHFFGLSHSDVVGNVMSYDRGSRPPFFDDAQAARMRARATRLLRSGEVGAGRAGSG